MARSKVALDNIRVSSSGQKLLRFLIDYMKGNEILDIGAGDCRIALAFGEAEYSVTAIDKKFFLNNSIFARTQVLKNFGKFELIEGDLFNLNIEKNFDGIILMGVLHYFSEDSQTQTLIEQIMNWLKPGGVVVLTWILTTQPSREVQYYPSLEYVQGISQEVGLKVATSWITKVHHKDQHGPHNHDLAYLVLERAV